MDSIERLPDVDGLDEMLAAGGGERIAVVGLGYVGLPVAVALARAFDDVLGFDISARRIEALKAGRDWTGEIGARELAASTLRYSADAASLAGRTLFIVTVPTPIDDARKPDLSPLESACALIGPWLTKGALVVFESTVYPGVTEEVCGPLLARASGLLQGEDFFLGYSPERINPGDHVHRLETITKVVAADSPAALDRVKRVYGAVVDAGLHVAASIKVAEAAKVLENTQRDINIALMNEMAVIMDLMGVRTRDVLEAAGTKWNFLPFAPGLVGGHCIGVDPYYLTFAAEQHGYHPEVILSGRRINNSMGKRVAQKLVKLLIQQGVEVRAARVGVLGLTFKQNVPDIRNSKVPDILAELADFGIRPIVHDPRANADEAVHEYGVELASLVAFRDLDAVILAVDHEEYVAGRDVIAGFCREGGVFVDVRSVFSKDELPAHLAYWSL